MTILERLKMFGSPMLSGLSVMVVDTGTKLDGEMVTDTNTVRKGSELFMTQKTFDAIREKCNAIN